MLAVELCPCLGMLGLIAYLTNWLGNPSSMASASTFFALVSSIWMPKGFSGIPILGSDWNLNPVVVLNSSLMLSMNCNSTPSPSFVYLGLYVAFS